MCSSTLCFFPPSYVMFSLSTAVPEILCCWRANSLRTLHILYQTIEVIGADNMCYRRDFSPNSTDDKIKISSEGHSEELNKSMWRAFLPHQRGNGSIGGGVRDLQQNEKCSVNLNRTQVSGDSEKAAIKLHICQSQYNNKTLPGSGSEMLESSHSGFFQLNPELTK